MTTLPMHQYQLYEPPLSSGRHGTVYRATHLTHRSQHAVKRLPINRHDVPSYRNTTMLLNETNHMSALKECPHIVRLDEVIHTEHTGEAVVLLVSELCTGGPLVVGESTSRFSYDQKVQILRNILHALDACHSHGILHGDIKPANILFERPEDLSTKLIDFGSSIKCSALYGAAVTHMTPFYMAPEVAQACGTVGYAADIWAFGILAYQLLYDTAEHPFSSPFDMNVVLKHYYRRDGVPLPPSLHRASKASIMLEAALQIDPKDRCTAKTALTLI